MKIALPKKYEPEFEFLSEILADPQDPTLRLIYADWLEEQGDVRADFLRIDLELHMRPKESLEYVEFLTHRPQLLESIDPLWVRLLASASLEKCPLLTDTPASTDETIYQAQFQFRCPKKWEKLAPGPNSDMRQCSECQKTVHYCHDIETARKHAKGGRCVALDPSVPRKRHDLDFVPSDYITMGIMLDIEDPR